MYNITCTHDTEGLLSLKDEWEALHQRSQASSVFLSWEWITACWESRSASADLWLLQAHDEQGRLVGIAPLMRTKRRVARVFSWPSLEFISPPDGSDHADFIIDREQVTAVTQALVAWLQQNRNWSEIYLDGLAAESAIIPLLNDNGLQTYSLEERECPFVIINQDWDSHFASLSKNKRQVQRRHWRKLDRDFPDQWAWRIVEDPEEVREVMKELFVLHARQWVPKGQPGHFSNDSLQALHQDLAQRFLRRGWLHLYQMTIEGKTAGVFYSFWYLNRAYYYASGFNSDYSQYNVGHILNEISLRQAFEHGLKEYDFLWGTQSYKLQWGTVLRMNLVVSCPVGSGARMYRNAIRAGSAFWKRIKYLLPGEMRTQVRERVLAFLR